MADELIAGRYIIQDELGRGASATVFRARDTTLDRNVALKVIASSLASDPEFTWRFEQEARLAARLDHPNIVTVHDVGTLPDGRAFIAMRLLDGKPLDRLMAERGQMTPNEVVQIVDQLAMALDYTHASGLVHRDVKPSNVTIDAAGRATLTDFGIARALDSARVTLPGLTIGTPRYMSPEQVRGEDTTPATDEYSLAVMAYEMMAGRPPFEGDGTALMYKIVHEPAPAPNSFNPWLPETGSAVIEKALSKLPRDRWASSGEFARELREALATSTLRGAAMAPGGHSGQTTIVSTPPTAVYHTGPNPAQPAAPVSTGNQPAGAAPTIAAAAAAAGAAEAAAHLSSPDTGSEPTLVVSTGSGPAVSDDAKRPITIIPPVVLPDSAKTTVAPTPEPLSPPPPLGPPDGAGHGAGSGGATQLAPLGGSPAAPGAGRGGGSGGAVLAPLGTPEPSAAVAVAEPETSMHTAAGGMPPGEPPKRKTALLWGGLAALGIGGAAVAAFLMVGGGDGNNAGADGDEDDDETPSVQASVEATATARPRTPTVTVGPGTPSPTPEPTETPVPTSTTGPGTPTSTPRPTSTNTSVPPTNVPATSVPATNTSVPPTATSVPPTATSVPPTATSAPAGLFVSISGISIVNGQYRVFFTSNSGPNAAGDHVHFYFDPSQHPYRDFYLSGQTYFEGFSTEGRPSGATHICGVSATGSHTFRSTGGSCWPIPSE